MKWLKVGAVIFASVAITALGIDAADTLQGSRSTLLGQVISTSGGPCPEGMTQILMANSFSCVDTYEASAGEDCKTQTPANELDTQNNIETTKCGADSKKGVLPWRFITREQAQTACLRSGKRLPTADEWFLFSAGTSDVNGTCNTDSSGVQSSGAHESCVSAVGVYDTVGNVWEWTSDDVIDGSHEGRKLPDAGYVVQVDSKGLAVLTSDKPSDLFYQDYFWSSAEGYYGMLRGGYYNSESDAGVYATHAETLPTSAGTAIGFRCVQ